MIIVKVNNTTYKITNKSRIMRDLDQCLEQLNSNRQEFEEIKFELLHKVYITQRKNSSKHMNRVYRLVAI